MKDAPKYPEHDKLQAVREASQAIGEFLDWLQAQDIVLCKWREGGDNGEPRMIPATEADLARIRARVGYKNSWEEFQAHRYGLDNPKFESWASGYIPVHRTILGLLADFFQIDQTKVQAEKQQLLDEIRRLNAAIQEVGKQ